MSELPDNAIEIDVWAMEPALTNAHGPGRAVWWKDAPPPEPTLEDKLADWWSDNDWVTGNIPKAMKEMIGRFDLMERHKMYAIHEHVIDTLKVEVADLKAELARMLSRSTRDW